MAVWKIFTFFLQSPIRVSTVNICICMYDSHDSQAILMMWMGLGSAESEPNHAKPRWAEPQGTVLSELWWSFSALKGLSSSRYALMNQPNMTIYDNSGRAVVQQEERRLHTHVYCHLLRFVAFLPHDYTAVGAGFFTVKYNAKLWLKLLIMWVTRT